MVFTDGSCVKKNNCSKASYGYYMKVYDNLFEYYEFSDYKILEGEKTNNKAELSGFILALEKLLEISNSNDTIKIYSDSEYTIKSLTLWLDTWKNNGWKTANKKPVKNIELIKKMDQLYNELKQKNPNIIIKHVYSHQKEPITGTEEWEIWNGNNIVDTNLQMLTKN